MTNEQIVMMIQAGENVTENMAQLYLQNWGIIRKMTQKYSNIEDPEDLQQEAYFGLARAAELWDPKQDVLFMSYAPYWIRQAITRYIYNHSTAIRVPINQRGLISRYNKAVNLYQMRFARDPKPIEVMALLEISRAQYEQLLKDIQTANVKSSSQPIGEDGENTLEDFLPDPSDPIEDVIEKIHKEELSRALWAQVDKLPEREAAVVRGKYQKEQTYSECGKALGISTERVRQLHERALRKLRSHRVAGRITPYLTESTAYSIGTHGGLSLFRKYHLTAQERAVMMLEERTGPIWQNVTIKEEQA